MNELKLKSAIRLALLSMACTSLISACAPYEPVSAPVISSASTVETIENNPHALFDRLDTNRDGFLSRGELDPLRMAERAAPLSIESTEAAFHRLDVDRDGFLSRIEAEATLSTVPGATFDRIDANRDGFLSMAEAEPHLRWLGTRGPHATWFDTLDTDRDGFLTRTEAEPLLRSTRLVAGRYEVGPFPLVSFDRLDTDRNGFLSRTEAAAILAHPAHFDRFDTNRDGYLSRAEADAMFRSGVGATTTFGGGVLIGPR